MEERLFSAVAVHKDGTRRLLGRFASNGAAVRAGWAALSSGDVWVVFILRRRVGLGGGADVIDWLYPWNVWGLPVGAALSTADARRFLESISPEEWEAITGGAEEDVAGE